MFFSLQIRHVYIRNKVVRLYASESYVHRTALLKLDMCLEVELSTVVYNGGPLH
jgi:hypothetical protein